MTLLDFVHDLELADVPRDVLVEARRCVLDLVGVAAAGSATELSRIVRDHAARHLRGMDTAVLLFDGRRVSPAGAALANAATIDAMDGHDGHRLTKGHAGAAVLPAALSVVDSETTGSDLLAAVLVGYEIANRAGIALHASAADYHSSGAWNALGAAAVVARLRGLGATATGHALGIAEYHAPRAPMMRGIDHPAMVKDSSGWGAHAGVSAALLAEDGFTGPPAELLSNLDDLGRRWTLREQYRKPHPVCRWAHPAIEAVLRLRVPPGEIDRIEVDTFAPAIRLATGMPANTEVAQYSLAFPVAIAAVHGAVPADFVAAPDCAGGEVRRLVESMVVREDFQATQRFPAERSAEVTVVRADTTVVRSGRVTAAGDPESPLDDATLTAKFLANTTPVLGDRAADLLAGLRELDRGPLAPLVELMST